jgi:hypothetical protein
MNASHSSSIHGTQANTTDPHGEASETAPGAGRYDPYLMIHKGIRALVTDALVRAGRMDAFDDDDTADVVARVRDLARLAESHAHHEERFIHPAMEARAPGSTRHVDEDHRTHRAALARLVDGCDAVERQAGAARAAAALELYRALALYVAKDLVHMHAEETENNAVLWATHTDAELVALTERLVAAIPPEQNAVFARWMASSSAPAERAQLLANARGRMPAPAFAGMLQGILSELRAKDRGKLEAALA